MKLDREKIQEEARKLGLVLIAGGVAARVFQHSIDTLTAIGVVLIGVGFVVIGALSADGGSNE